MRLVINTKRTHTDKHTFIVTFTVRVRLRLKLTVTPKPSTFNLNTLNQNRS